MVALGLESGVIGGPGQSEFFAFGRDPVGGSLVGVAQHFRLVFLAVVVDGGHDQLLLLLGLLARRVVGLGVAVEFISYLVAH